jgi:glutaminyl-peptide cyclotransferase
MRIATNNKRLLFILVTIVLLLVVSVAIILLLKKDNNPQFDGQRAYTDVKYQVDLGPRTMGSSAHTEEVDWIINQLKEADWQVETQETVISGQPITNIIAKRGEGKPWIILGSHYDSRPIADRDPNPANRTQPVPGANDGASSTAALLELARVIPKDLNKQIWLVFFDAEDAGTSSGSGWANGSEYFVSQLQGKPDHVVILDMIGDKDLNIYMERNSDKVLNQEIWGVAKELGYTQFIPKYKYDIIDDHIPFIKAGILATDVIDFDYPAWHTTEDTLDKVSAESLKAVGDTILKWLEQYPKTSTTTQ